MKTTTITKIVDGDTVVDNNNIYRLIGVDTPETYSFDSDSSTVGPSYYFGIKAKDFTTNFSLKKKVSIKMNGVDSYDRSLAIISKGNDSLNIELVERGLGIVRYISSSPNNPFYYEDNYFIDEIYEAQSRAILNKEGFWCEKISTLMQIYPGTSFSYWNNLINSAK